MGSFGWGNLIAVVAVLVSAASLAFTVRTSRDAEAAAAASAKRQEHMARSFDELVAAAKRIAEAAGNRQRAGARTAAPSGAADGSADEGPRWQVENPAPGRFLLRNLSSSVRHGVRIHAGSPDEATEAVDLEPLSAREFALPHAPAAPSPQAVRVSDAEHPEPLEVPVDPWF